MVTLPHWATVQLRYVPGLPMVTGSMTSPAAVAANGQGIREPTDDLSDGGDAVGKLKRVHERADEEIAAGVHAPAEVEGIAA